MGDRRKARELALQALFYLDMDQAFDDNKAADNIKAFCNSHEEAITKGVEPFFMDLLQGVIEQCRTIDDLLNRYSKNWKISRMPVVDRNIMRIAVFELLKRPDIPRSVSINEAVEMGKKFGTRDSGPFINGVLDRIETEEKAD